MVYFYGRDKILCLLGNLWYEMCFSSCGYRSPLKTAVTSNPFPLSSQVQPWALRLLWWWLWQRWRHLILSGGLSPSGPAPGCTCFHLVWLSIIQSDPSVSASGAVSSPRETQSSWDPLGCGQTGGLLGLSVHHIHHCQARSPSTEPQERQETESSRGG